MPKLSQTKKCRKNFSFFIILGYTIFVVILGVTYAYFSSTLRINGLVSIDGYVWPEGILPTVPVETDEGTQFSTSFQSDYLTGDNISSSAQGRFDNVNEEYDASTSTYHMTITKNYAFLQSFRPTTENFNLNFTIENYSTSVWTDGNVTNSYSSNGNLLSNVSGTIDKTTLAPNETVTLNMQFTLKIYGSFNGTSYTDQIIYKVNYTVDGEIRTTTVIIDFVCS